MLRYIALGPDELSLTGVGSRSRSEWNWSLGLLALKQEFPSVAVEISDRPFTTPPLIRVSEWRGFAFDPYAHDAVMFGERPITRLHVVGPRDRETTATALEALTRYQSLIARRNRYSSVPVWDGLLRRHQELHDFSQPLVGACYVHGLDTWQWLLRLWPLASLSIQAAALLHHVPHLSRLAEVERSRATFGKPSQATDGLEALRVSLRGLGLACDELERLLELIAGHEDVPSSLEQTLLAEADALSFFSLESATYLDTYGEEQMERRVAFTLARLRTDTLRRLRAVRLRNDVEKLVVGKLRLQRLAALSSAEG